MTRVGQGSRIGALALTLGALSGCKDAAPEPWRTLESDAFAEAQASGRHVVVDFRARWCEPCRAMEEVLANGEVYGELTASFVPLAFDITQLTTKDTATKAKYKVFDLPSVVFVDAAGAELGRFEDETVTEERFVSVLREVVAAHPPRR